MRRAKTNSVFSFQSGGSGMLSYSTPGNWRKGRWAKTAPRSARTATARVTARRIRRGCRAVVDFGKPIRILWHAAEGREVKRPPAPAAGSAKRDRHAPRVLAVHPHRDGNFAASGERSRQRAEVHLVESRVL